jgi:hypothetical protein
MLTHRRQLEEAGFVGFFSFERIRAEPKLIPVEAGVYVVLTPPEFMPRFLTQNAGGWHKGKNPTVPVENLKENWVEDVEVLYFGKADGGKNGRRGLRKRIGEYAKHGTGIPAGHSGGRSIWQLQNAQSLLVCWRLSDSPVRLENELLRQFVSAFGKRPFANLIGGMK